MSTPDFSRVEPFQIGEYEFNGEYIMHAVGMYGGLDEEMRDLAAWVAFWGAMVSDAKAHHDVKESAYRVERDRWKKEQLTTRTPKPTKTSLDDEWRTLPEYGKWHAETTKAERAWNIAQYVYEALLRKSNMLSGLGRIESDQRFARANPGMPTPTGV